MRNRDTTRSDTSKTKESGRGILFVSLAHFAYLYAIIADKISMV